MTSRKDSDEYYVIDLCDEILGLKASRQHTFDFLRGDGKPGRKGRKLPVDAYYPDLKLVVEYKELQHTESVPFFNKKTTVSGVSRDEQRRIYDQRRRDVLPKHGIQLIEISYTDLKHDSRKRLTRSRQADIVVIQRLLSNVQDKNNRNNLTSKKPVKGGTQTWVDHAFSKLGCWALFIFAIIFVSIFFLLLLLLSYLTISVFNLDEASAFIIVTISIFVIAGIFAYYMTSEDEKKNKRKGTSSTHNDTSYYSHYPAVCPHCGSYNIGPIDDNGGFCCLDCGLQWYQTY